MEGGAQCPRELGGGDARGDVQANEQRRRDWLEEGRAWAARLARAGGYGVERTGGRRKGGERGKEKRRENKERKMWDSRLRGM